ncbi:response regulator [Flavobacterium sp. GT3R68]|uniref:response regulator n=1 Tax=Flavobacterium sp. GT3R68 TaxID=2594437 RepID=UPI000F8835CD|nr:response regulator [Flavobacterium sp. GT3R68]RTY95874.1 response regulator [Flavobacterium sp. GSN2]TRW93646.1 response regulator [Flavobacterium sp. GT3R68]
MNRIKLLTIIDDDEVFVFLTTKAIEKTNIVDKVTVFHNGKQALTFFEQNFNKPELLPEIILLDLFMPVMDGWQFLEEFIKIQPRFEKKIVVYVITSSISPIDAKKAKTITQISDFIVKPVTKEKLLDNILKL